MVTEKISPTLMGRCECFDCFIWPFMKQGCNIMNKKVLGKHLVNVSFGISTSAWNFCISYPKSSIFCRRDPRPLYIFCSTRIPVQWRASMCQMCRVWHLSSQAALSWAPYATLWAPTIYFTHGGAHMPMLLCQFIQAPFSLLPPHPHILSLCLSFYSCPANVAL